ncbi:MAG: amino acid ABC transporter permease [Acidimicrobiia bacterium]|nr:amino acid ABC transporter permease [Acidimicrobiia bacterium]MDH4306260.1 amino acid ABC transporter permease [Acidimicrobiia bacterium]MDH5292416.1 amino acid ABC transporter permease [Acidimicrobiia bacterium]
MTETWTAPKATAAEWARRNLFNRWYNSALTVVLGVFLAWLAYKLVVVLFGIDYEIIRRNLLLFMVGEFPRDQIERPFISTILFGLAFGLGAATAAASARHAAAEADLAYAAPTPRMLVRRFWPLLALVAALLAFTRTVMPTVMALSTILGGAALYFGARGMPRSMVRWGWMGTLVLGIAAFAVIIVGVDGGWNAWGGFQINIFLAIAGIVIAFPFGLLLALGRRSSLPVVRYLSVTYIEFIRGVPLITLLLMGVFALGFFLPEALRPGPAIRVLIAIVMFEAAYVAEVVRGGLQAVPKGQLEAGQALGLPAWKTTRLIILPQALRATIPAMVGQFISLYKDTTLVNLVGMFDVLEVALVVNSQSDFIGKRLFFLTLAFAGVLFWVGSYTMSREAQRLEKKLGIGER